MTGPEEADIEILRREAAFQGYFRIDAYTLRHRTYAGGWTPEIDLEVFERGRTVAVLPYDPERDTVVLIEQFRVGAHAAGLEPWLIEAVAGTREGDESAGETVRREVLEEAGCEVADLEPIGEFLLSPGACSESCAMFIGRVDSDGVGGIHGIAHEGEDIRVETVPAAEAIELVLSGKVPSAYGAIPLLWLAANREDLRRRWLQGPGISG